MKRDISTVPQTDTPMGRSSSTLTFLFTDIEGSTNLWERHPQAALETIAVHDHVIQEAVGRHGGRVFKSKGDGFCTVFSAAHEALESAVECQYTLQQVNWPTPIEEIKVRMAIHSGTADVRDGDYFGPPLNRVARMEAAAHGGQIILSEATKALVEDLLPAGVDLVDLGDYQLRSLKRPERIYQAITPKLPTKFPPLKTLKKEKSALPAQATSFVGRNKELGQISELLSQIECRLLTLVGPGGIGKTRLALQVSEHLLDEYPGGLYFVPLAPITSTEFIIPSIADALNFAFDTHSSDLDPKSQLFDYLKNRKALLLMDNFEHLVESAGLLVEILEQAPDIKVLVTSRERLNVQAEWIFEVKSMNYPRNGSSQSIEEFSAVQLFLARAQKADRAFSLSVDQQSCLSRICQLVDGTPLGLELAAAWVSILSCQEIAEEIDRNIDFLATTLRDVPERQRSVRAAFEYSWGLLTDELKASYRKLMAFRGGFDRQAASEVAGVSLLQLVQLVNKSLLWRRDDGRYERHELLGQFASEKLNSSPDEKQNIRDNHSHYYLKYLSVRVPYLRGAAMVEFREEIRQEMENVKEGIAWSSKEWPDDLGRDGLEDLGRFYTVQGWHEGFDTFRRIVQELESAYGCEIDVNKTGHLGLLTARVWLAQFYSALGRHEESEEICQNLLPHIRKMGNSIDLAVSLLNMGINAIYRSENELAIDCLAESIAVSRVIGDAEGLGEALLWLGWAEYSMGLFQDAHAHFQESYSHYQQLEDSWGLAFALSKLGLIADAMEDHDLAHRYHSEAKETFIRLGDVAGEGYTISRLSMTAYGQGNYFEAKRLGYESYGKFEAIGHRWGMMAAMCRTGFALIGLGEYEQAEDQFREALDRAVSFKMITSALYALAGLACVLGRTGRSEQGAEAFYFVLDHPGTPAVYRLLAEPYFDELKQELSHDLLDQAKERAGMLEIGDFSTGWLNLGGAPTDS